MWLIALDLPKESRPHERVLLLNVIEDEELGVTLAAAVR
jgi:hypothetical protein